jgi:DNA-binding MarR family transcriptional regulator
MILENHLAALGTLIQDRMTAEFGGMSPSASAILLTLANRGPLPVSELARIVGVTQPTATRLLDGLAREGFVVRGRKQGRRVEISLTRAGARQAGAHQRKRAALAADLLAPLAPGERAALGKAIAKVLSGATGSRAFARTTCRFCDHGLCRGDDCPIGSRATELESAGGAPC